MNGGYYVEFRDQRDLEQHTKVYNEMLVMTRAIRAAHKCECCGAASPKNAMRHDGEIVVTCKACVGKKPTAERRAINERLAEMRASLVEMEKRCTP